MMVPDWAAGQIQLIRSAEAMTQLVREWLAAELDALMRSAYMGTAVTRLQLGQSAMAPSETLTIETVRRAQERLEASLPTLEPLKLPVTTRVHHGETYKVAARICTSGEVVPVLLGQKHPEKDPRTAHLLGFCMGVVKDDDPHVTWDSEGMMEAR